MTYSLQQHYHAKAPSSRTAFSALYIALNVNCHTSPTTVFSLSPKMSAPNFDKPNEGIIGQAANSVKNAANYVSESAQGNTAEASNEANKQQAKGNAGDTSVTGRAEGALDAASDKVDEKKHEGSAKANKENI